MKPWVRVRAFCHRVGVEFRIMRSLTYSQQSPFSSRLGIQWTDRVLLIAERGLRDPLTIGHSIHEIGHIVATREDPNNVDEGDFVAWEWRAAIVCGVERQWWRLAMENYGTDTGDDFGDISLQAQRGYMRERMAVGRAIGNVSPSGRPVSLR